MKKQLFSILLAAVMALPTAIPANAQSLSDADPAVQPLSGITVSVPYACPVVYERIMAMESAYPSGMEWTNDNTYFWNGGGTYSGGGGCVAFAYILSDAAFGSLPCTEYYSFDASRVRVGDILRNSYHSFVVLEVHADHVVIAEGNINSSILWGRTVSFDEIGNSGFESHITRYPEDFAFAETSTEAEQGDTFQIDVISRDALSLTWESSNPSAATVDGNGNVTAVGGGEAVITASSSTYSASFTVRVEGDLPAGDVSGDALVDATDAAMILVSAAAEGAGNDGGFTEAQRLAADVDVNGVHDSTDAAWILQYAAAAGSGYSGSFEDFLNNGGYVEV